MRWIVCLFAVVTLGASGCKKDPPAAPAAGSGSGSAVGSGSATTPTAADGRPTCDATTKLVPKCGLEYMNYFTARACGCATAECVGDVQRDLEAWSKTAPDKIDMSVQPTREQAEQLGTLVNMMTGCIEAKVDTETPTPTEQPELGSGSGSGSATGSGSGS